MPESPEVLPTRSTPIRLWTVVPELCRVTKRLRSHRLFPPSITRRDMRETDEMDSEITRADLGRIANRLAAATNGPWAALVEGRDHVSGDDFIRTCAVNRDSQDMYVSMSTDHGLQPAGPEDLDFIANSWQDIAWLIEVLSAQLAERGTGINPTDVHAEQEKGRVALFLDQVDLDWLSKHCGCSEAAESVTTERCARIRFRASATLHKAGLRD